MPNRLPHIPHYFLLVDFSLVREILVGTGSRYPPGTPTPMSEHPTEAVEPTPTPETVSVKPWRIGDTREDGQVLCDIEFDGYYIWGTPEQYACVLRFRESLLSRAEEEKLRKKEAKAAEALARYRARMADPAERAKRSAASAAWRKANPERHRELIRAWREANPSYYKEARKKDPLASVTSRVRSRIGSAFRAKGLAKRTKSQLMLGCTFQYFKDYLESWFLEGMTWDNRHLWHIDHIVPLCLAQSENELMALNHHTNLRPLWKNANLSKNRKLPEESDLPPLVHPTVRFILARARVSDSASQL